MNKASTIRRWIPLIGAMILFSSILMGTLLQPASGALITEFKLPVDVRPRSVAVDDSGRVWFTEEFGNRIGYLSGTTIYEFNVPTIGSDPWDLVWDEDEDELWFTEFNAGKIGRLKLGPPTYVEFNLVNAGDTDPDPMGITLDQNRTLKNVWFTEFSGDAIGKIYYNSTGSLKNRWAYTRYYMSSGSGPWDIAVSPIDRYVWFTEYTAKKICSFNPWTLIFKEYPIVIPGVSNFNPKDIAVDEDGFIWFTIDVATPSSYDKIGRLNPWTAEFTFYDIPTLDSGPYGIVIDENNHIWFTENTKSKIGRLDPISRYITEFDLPDSTSYPIGITTSKDEKTPIWFAEWGSNRIGKLDPNTGKKYSTVTTITSATTTITNNTSTITSIPAATTSAVVFSKSTTPGESPTATFHVATSTSSTNRYATSTLTTNTETVFVMPTSTTVTTTSWIVSTTTTKTTSTDTLTSFVSTASTTTTTTTSATFTTPVETKTTYTTMEAVLKEYVSTTTITEFASTSYRMKTTTAQFYTSFSTSTILKTTTIYSTITKTITSYTTVTAGVTVPSILAFVILFFNFHAGGRKRED